MTSEWNTDEEGNVIDCGQCGHRFCGDCGLCHNPHCVVGEEECEAAASHLHGFMADPVDALALVGEAELLRIGMSGGRALIEEQPKPKPATDTLTLDLFDTQHNLFSGTEEQ